MKIARIWLLWVFGFLKTLNSGVLAKNLVVASYNLWNVMFQWETRKHYIADMVTNSWLLFFLILFLAIKCNVFI